MGKFALGIHAVNVAYTAGNESSYHRQVREGIVPLLNMLIRHPNWCFNIQINGFSIEFIANHYPEVLELMRILIKSNQIELISCTYSPQIWISFPKYDLIKSIQLNQDLLKSLDLQASRIFFTQENFSGEGVKGLKEWFDIAIIKDDYYYYLYEKPENALDFPPYLNLNDMKIMIGWGHILEGLAQDFFSRSDLTALEKIVVRKNHAFLKSRHLNNEKSDKLNNFIGKYKDIEWKWYHIGSSERFGKAHMRPEIATRCMFDPNWNYYSERHLIELESKGFILTGVQSFLNTLEKRNFEAPKCKHLLDGSWNMENSKGGYIWCGINSSPHEDDMMIRNQNWKSRVRLLAVESLTKIFPNEVAKIPEVEARVKNAWKHQLLAEICDSTGWFPSPYEVQYSLVESDVVFEEISHVVYLLKAALSVDSFIVNTKTNTLLKSYTETIETLKEIKKAKCWINKIRIIGAKGRIHFYEIDNKNQRVIADFTPTEPFCGIELEFNVDYLLYSPALMENESVKVQLSDIKPEKVYLPLPNGLICIKEDLYLIKHNEYLSISACIHWSSKKLILGITNPHNYDIHWELTLYKGDLKSAIERAEAINVTPIVNLP